MPLQGNLTQTPPMRGVLGESAKKQARTLIYTPSVDTALRELPDVDITNMSDNSLIFWDAAVTKFKIQDVLEALKVDNVSINDNTISTTDTDGDLILDPDGIGVVKVSSTEAFITASGSESTRPLPSVVGDAAIRYNTTSNRFEGTVGGNWTGLGGVVDIDQDTYITAEQVSDDDTLRFFAGGSQAMAVSPTGVSITGALTADNIKIDGNVISSVDSNGDIILQPEGSGLIKLVTDDAVIIASGTSSTRPSALSVGDAALRYNTTTNRFEGTVGGYWTGLGGVVDIDQDTYITAEQGSDDDTLRFYAGGAEVVTMSPSVTSISDFNTSLITVGLLGTPSSGKLTVYSDADFNNGIDVLSGNVDITNNLNVDGNTVIGGNLTVNGTTTIVNSTVTQLSDPVVKVGDGSIATGDGLDRGVSFDWGDGAAVQTGFFGMDIQTGRFSFQKVRGLGTTDNFSTPWGDAQFDDLYLSTNLYTDNITTVSGDLTIAPAGGDTSVTGTLSVSTNLTVNGNVDFVNDVPVTSGGTGLSSFSNNSIMISNGTGTAVGFITPPTTTPEDYIITFNSAGVPISSNLIDGGTF